MAAGDTAASAARASAPGTGQRSRTGSSAQEAAQPAGQDLRLRASVRLDRYDFGITKSKGWPPGTSASGSTSSPTGCEPGRYRMLGGSTWQ
jgi:hypothetical protein